MSGDALAGFRDEGAIAQGDERVANELAAEEAGQPLRPDVDSTTGDSTGTGLEPRPSAEEAAAERAADAARKEEARETGADPRDLARDAIYKKRKTQFDEETDLSQLDPAQRQHVERMRAEAGMEPDPEPAPAPAAPAPATPAPEGQPPAAPAPASAEQTDHVNIRVYGQLRSVPATEVEAAGRKVLGDGEHTMAEIIAAGKREIQTRESADVRMQRASEHEASIKKYEADVRAFVRQAEDNLRRGLTADGQPIQAATPPATTEGAPSPEPPATGAPDEEAIRKAAEKVVSNLWSGQVQEGTDNLVALLTQTAHGRGQATATQPEEMQRVVQAAVAEALTERETRERGQTLREQTAEANRIFREDFADLAADGFARASVKGLFDQYGSDPSIKDLPLPDRMRRAASEVRERLGGKRPAGETSDEEIAQILSARRSEKALVPSPPRGTGTRQAPPPPDRPKSNSEYVQELAKMRMR